MSHDPRPDPTHAVLGGVPPAGAPEDVRRAHFDELYQNRDEPWQYSHFAAEMLRHDHVARLARSLHAQRPRRLLDIGSSLGQLTARVVGVASELHAIDLAPAAVERTRRRCLEAAHRRPGAEASAAAGLLRFYAGSATALPFRSKSFDLILLCDGLVSWRLSDHEQRSVLDQVHRICVPGGYVILTEALKQGQIDPFVERVGSSPFRVESVEYLHDRLWYSLERGLRPVHHRRAAQAVLASRGVARVLGALSRLGGRRGTKHICIVARRPASGEGA